MSWKKERNNTKWWYGNSIANKNIWTPNLFKVYQKKDNIYMEIVHNLIDKEIIREDYNELMRF